MSDSIHCPICSGGRRLARVLLGSRLTGLIALLAAIGLGFGLTDPYFRDPFNLLDRTRHWVEIGLMAVPMTFIIAGGGIDLSVASLMAASGIVGGLCFRELGWPIWAALGAMAAAGLLGGLFNGVVVSRARVPALVTTLATLGLYRGLAMGLSHANPIGNFPAAYTTWGSFSAVRWGQLPIPTQTILLVIVAAVGEVLFRKTRAGRWSVQLGENERAARFATVPVSSVQLRLYAASGLVCGVAAILYTGRFATAHPAAAIGMEMEVIAAVVIGGTRITGGSGSVLGTFVGLLILGLLRYGLEMRGVDQQNQIVLIGVLVIVAAVFNEWIARRRQRRRA